MSKAKDELTGLEKLILKLKYSKGKLIMKMEGQHA